MMFLQRNIHKHTWTSPGWKSHNQNDHILTDMRWQFQYTRCMSFQVNCETDHYLVVTKLDIFAVSKHVTQNFNAVKFTLRKLNDLEVRKQNQIKI
jgi:hypothetical protein